MPFPKLPAAIREVQPVPKARQQATAGNLDQVPCPGLHDWSPEWEQYLLRSWGESRNRASLCPRRLSLWSLPREELRAETADRIQKGRGSCLVRGTRATGS